MPFFSVIIPTYNRSKEIVNALDSVVCQTFNDFEIIVIDDFSTDDTELTIKELNIPNLIFIKNQRKKGACGARNTGCDIANGEWLAFLDSDDLINKFNPYPWYTELEKFIIDDKKNALTFKRAITGIDVVRKTNWRNVFPEYIDWFDSIKSNDL